MVQTRRTTDGPQNSTSQPHLNDNPPPLSQRANHIVPPNSQAKGMDSNYADSVAADNSQTEITKLRIENQALQMLLKEHFRKQAS